MKLGVSTSCCYDWDFDIIYTSAKDLGYNGIEIRKLADSVYAPRMKPFREAVIATTIQKLVAIGIEIPLLASSAVVGKEGLVEESIAEVEAYTTLAEKLKTQYVRVLAGTRPDDYDCDFELLVDTLSEMCDIAARRDVSILVETNSIFSDATLLREMLDIVKKPNLGVLWDINYPYRYFNESPKATVDILKENIKFVHIKDSVAKGDGVEYRLMGHGDLPIGEVITALGTIGYTGYLSFEWIPKWSSELVEPGIVMAQYIGFMQRELRKYM